MIVEYFSWLIIVLINMKIAIATDIYLQPGTQSVTMQQSMKNVVH